MLKSIIGWQKKGRIPIKGEELVSKDYRERYKRIAQSEEFKKTHEGMSVGEVMHVEGEESVWIKELQDKLDSLSKEDFEKVWSKYSQYGKGEEPVSKGLEEASKNYALNNTPWDDCKDEIQESFKAGAKWKEQQIMAKAVEGVLTFNHDGRVLFGFIVPDSFCDDVIFKDMDKVKLIIIKKNKDE